MRWPRLKLWTIMVGIVGVAIILSLAAARWRSIDWNSTRLDKGSEMLIEVLDPPTGRVALNSAMGPRHVNGRSYESLENGVRVKVVDDSHESEWVINPNGEGPGVVKDNRHVDVTVISGPLKGTSGNVGRRFLRPAPWRKAEE